MKVKILSNLVLICLIEIMSAFRFKSPDIFRAEKSDKSSFYNHLLKKNTNGSTCTFTFKLNQPAITSAGIYTVDGTLIRTLWSGVYYQEGTHSATWDGTDDEGILVSDGNYKVKVLSNNVNYTWEGVLGNTSDSLTGGSVYRGSRSINSMAFAGTIAFLSKGYNEGSPSEASFNANNPNTQIKIFPNEGTGQATQFVATDNTNVYWAGFDSWNKKSSFVFVTRITDNRETILSGSVPLKSKIGRKYLSSIDNVNEQNATITGMTVQKKGQYIFVARSGLNTIHVIDKQTGKLVRSLQFNAATSLAIDQQDNLWITYNNAGFVIIEKFYVNSDGTLSPLNIVLKNLINPLAIGVSPDNNNIVVADGGTSQQLKAFNNKNGNPVWVFGEQGGYANGATVKDDKFYFSDNRGTLSTFITFEPNGSFWVGDPGNERVQHFTGYRTFIDRIMYLPTSYSCAVDHNNTSRVFSDYLEFSVDYSKPLAPNNGSWKLVKNWGYNISSDYDDAYHRLNVVNTLSNGRTYAFLFNRATHVTQLIELAPNDQVRFTGVLFNSVNIQLYPDGSLKQEPIVRLGVPTVWTEKSLLNFDVSNNPVWSAEKVIATSPPATIEDPLYWGNPNTLRTGEITSTGLLISFDGGLPPYGSDEWHLGAIKLNDNKWLWRTAKATDKAYAGEFPTDGSYDIGNGVKYGGSDALVIGRNIIWGYHGEFWKNGQVNKFNHVYDDGLMVGQFGITGKEVAGIDAPAMFAGNSFSVALISDLNGNGYLYHNDESYHGGVHRWKITGLATINEQTIPVTLTSTTHGLLGQYFRGSDMNNLNLINTQIDSAFIPEIHGAKLPTGNFSVIWTGYIQPSYSETYSFDGNTNNKIKLLVGRNILINDLAENGQSLNNTISLKAGKKYPIRVECSNYQSESIGLISWHSVSQPKQPIYSSQLYAINIPNRSQGIDLMENLPHKSILSDNHYGWRRDPATEDSTDMYTKWWDVRTNYKIFDKQSSPDIYIRYRQISGVSTVTRDLGASDVSLNNWQLTGKINYEGNYFNSDTKLGPDGNGGSFFEILDDHGKAIVRIFVHINNTTNIASMYINNAIVAQDNNNIIRAIVGKFQTFNINVNAGVVTFNYGTFQPVTTTIFDASANWRKPKTVRFYFWCKGSNYDRTLDIANLNYSFN